MEQRLTEKWYRDGSRPWLLQPFSWLYAAAMQARRGAYANGWFHTHSVGKPVVVVGNLTVGGTGKTPLVIWLALELAKQGWKPGIVSRGYGGSGVTRFVQSDSPWQEVGDEPLVLRDRTGCATVVSRDRVAGACALITGGADVVIADDGLQHLRLGRACEIVVVDGARGFGNGRVLPAGPLREPVARLQRADAVVVNGASEHPSLTRATARLASEPLQMRLMGTEARRVDGQGTPRPLEAFRGGPVHAVAGIGNPGRFFRDLRSHGLRLIEHPFPDHHPFTARDLEFADSLPVLMTEKDAVKCRSFANPRLWYMPVAAVFSEAHARQLLSQVQRRLQAFSAPGG